MTTDTGSPGTPDGRGLADALDCTDTRLVEHLGEALANAEDPVARFHIRQALQLLAEE